MLVIVNIRSRFFIKSVDKYGKMCYNMRKCTDRIFRRNMELKFASKCDLPRLYGFFGEAVSDLRSKGIYIWDDVYPACMLESDIESGGLYYIEENDEILAVFALCDINECEGAVAWEDNAAEALFIYRLAVSPHHQNRGIGALALRFAAEEAGKRGAKYLRLLVGDQNEPAIHLYRKCGFSEAQGVFTKIVSDEITLSELGFEIKTK